MGQCILVWRPNLEARLIKLQNQLRIPDADRFIPDIKLQKPQIVEIRAVRVQPTKFDSQGRVIVEKETSSLHSYITVTEKISSEEKKLETVGAPHVYFFLFAEVSESLSQRVRNSGNRVGKVEGIRLLMLKLEHWNIMKI